MLLNFQKPGPLGHLFGKVSEMEIALWSGAIAGKISDFLCLLFAYANADTMQSCRNFDHYLI